MPRAGAWPASLSAKGSTYPSRAVWERGAEEAINVLEGSVIATLNTLASSWSNWVKLVGASG